MLKPFLLLFAGLMLLCETTGTAHADLLLTVTDAGGGNTRWVFSGSTVSIGGSGGPINSFWGQNLGPGNPVNTSAGSQPVLSGSGTLTTTLAGTQAVINTWTQPVSTTNIAPRVGAISWNAGDTLTWSGDLITSVPFSNFNPGVYTTNTILNSVSISQPLRVTVIPEPSSSLALLLVGVGGIAFSRRRKNTQA